MLVGERVVADDREPMVTPRELREIGAAWSPFRSVAAWYLWRAADAAKAAAKAP